MKLNTQTLSMFMCTLISIYYLNYTMNLVATSYGCCYCNYVSEITLGATCHLQTCYNFLKQVAANLLMTSFDDQLPTSLLTTVNRMVVNPDCKVCEQHP